MKQSKKNPANDPNAAIEAWRSARIAAKEAEAAWNIVFDAAEKGRPAGGHISAETQIKVIEATIAKYEAKEAACIAEGPATAAIDAAEAEAGDPLAKACELRTLRDDLIVLSTEQDRMRAELAAAEAAPRARLAMALASLPELAARRAAQDLPPPRRIPTLAYSLYGHGPNAQLDLLAASIERGTPVQSYTSDLRSLRAEETKLRASIERTRRAAEERVAELARYEKRRERERAEAAERETASLKAMQAKYRAEVAEQEALAAAHRAGPAVANESDLPAYEEPAPRAGWRNL